jgi:hypothetical protein
LEPLELSQWALAVAIALAYLAAVDLEKWITNRRSARTGPASAAVQEPHITSTSPGAAASNRCAPGESPKLSSNAENGA